jgi:hypothetical protein
MTKYNVSLACVLPSNPDIKVESETEADAVRRAIAEFNSPDWLDKGYYVEAQQDGTPSLDLNRPRLRRTGHRWRLCRTRIKNQPTAP